MDVFYPINCFYGKLKKILHDSQIKEINNKKELLTLFLFNTPKATNHTHHFSLHA